VTVEERVGVRDESGGARRGSGPMRSVAPELPAHSVQSARLEQASQLHRQGRLEAAELLYREILAATPEHGEALYRLGILSMQLGRIDEAIAAMQRSLAASPRQPVVALSLAKACLQAGRYPEALAACECALQLQPGFDAALFERGNALMRLERTRDAAHCYRQLLERAPTHVEAWCNQGIALQELGDWPGAIASYDRALALRPDMAEAHYNRGNALYAAGQYADALASFERTLRWRPESEAAHHGRGLALRQLRAPEDALAAFERALALRPTYLDALVNRGNVWRELARPEAALQSYELALQRDPECVEALSNRGNALLDLGRHADAIESYAAALEREPERADILANRASALQQYGQYELAAAGFERLLHVAPRYDYALGSLLQCRLQVCAWHGWAPNAAQIPIEVQQGRRVIHPFAMLAVSAAAQSQLQAAQLYVQGLRLSEAAPPEAAPPARAARRERRKVRLAYVSADFREHAVSYLMAGVFERHDRRRFETSAISLLPAEQSAMGQRVGAAFDRFEDVSRRSDREIAALMRELEIDVAVDLMGYTHRTRPGVFARRPAPVQVSYLGYPGTTGAPWIDYLIADEFVVPPSQRRWYTEHVVYLPECFQANDDWRAIDEPPTRAELGLPTAGPVLCSFNNTYKLNPQMFEVWMRLLRAVPASVLWLVGDRPSTRENLRSAAAALGVAPERLVFAERLPYAQHLARSSVADLFLDTLPFNGGTTASDALRVGVPVLTCTGDAFAARMAGSLLRTLGLPELITGNLEHYERRALELLRHPDRLAVLRARLAEPGRRARLFDSARCCDALEEAYRQMAERSWRGEPPGGFAVTPRQPESGILAP
jgi:predicted O-linked N-acetylglucosamine transferase (SPINDLY family)